MGFRALPLIRIQGQGFRAWGWGLRGLGLGFWIVRVVMSLALRVALGAWTLEAENPEARSLKPNPYLNPKSK